MKKRTRIILIISIIVTVFLIVGLSVFFLYNQELDNNVCEENTKIPYRIEMLEDTPEIFNPYPIRVGTFPFGSYKINWTYEEAIFWPDREFLTVYYREQKIVDRMELTEIIPRHGFFHFYDSDKEQLIFLLRDSYGVASLRALNLNGETIFETEGRRNLIPVDAFLNTDGNYVVIFNNWLEGNIIKSIYTSTGTFISSNTIYSSENSIHYIGTINDNIYFFDSRSLDAMRTTGFYPYARVRTYLKSIDFNGELMINKSINDIFNVESIDHNNFFLTPERIVMFGEYMIKPKSERRPSFIIYDINNAEFKTTGYIENLNLSRNYRMHSFPRFSEYNILYAQRADGRYMRLTIDFDC